MRTFFRAFFGCWSLLISSSVLAQVPQAGFTVPAQACLGQEVYIQNTSMNATRYEWDFCQGDLGLAPTATSAGTITGNVTTGIDVVFDGTNWFGFVTSRGSNTIIRLDFGSSLTNTPTQLDLGNISSVINLPTDIKIIFDNGSWYGFVYGVSSSVVTRIDFGNSLTNTTTSSSPISATVIVTGSGTVNSGLDMQYDGGLWYVLYTTGSLVNIARLVTVTSVPVPADKISATVTGATSLADIKILKSGSQWFAYSVAYGSRSLHRLSFGTTLFATPTSTTITGSIGIIIGSLTPYGIDGGFDNGNYYIFISTLEGDFIRVNLGSDLTAAPVSGGTLGNLGVLSNTLILKLVKSLSDWTAFSPNWNFGQLYRVSFPNPASCPANLSYSTSTAPFISYSAAGPQYISLRSFNGGSVDELDNSILVTSLTAPPIGFTSQNVCVNNAVNFNASSSGGISGYSWNFGDAGTSTAINPSHTYTSTGIYTVSLIVTGSNGCFNQAQNGLTIYNSPVASFSIPVASPVCSNQLFTFTNSSTADVGSSPTWQWSVDGIPAATSQNLVWSFPTTENASIGLIASIPGCSSPATQSFNVQQIGPLTDFTISGICLGESTQFQNTSVGTITSFTWDFGDGNGSNQTSPANSYAAIGPYTVKLSSTSPNGCQNSATKGLTIYSTPQSDFTLDLPPFSCSGSPSQFNDATPIPTDSNLSSWSWNFGDAMNGTSLQRSPLYTYTLAGPYNVSLTVSTNFGCQSTVQKPITITQAPVAAFTNVPACVNQGTQFTDSSSGSIKSWFWQIGSNTYSFQNPIHVFGAQGSYSAKLTVTDNNGCITQITKPISVPVSQSPDFSITNACATKPSVFQDISPVTSDPFISYQWDFAGLGTGTGAITQFVFPSITTYPVTMAAHATSGCVYAVTKQVNVIVPPVASFTTSADTGPVPLTVQFTNTSTNATAYLWQFHDANSTTSMTVSPSFTFDVLGNYVVDLSASNTGGCVDVSSKAINAVVPGMDAAVSQLQLVPDMATGGMQVLFVVTNKGNITIVNPIVQVEFSGSVTLREQLILSLAAGESASQVLHYSFLPSGLSYVCLTVQVSDDLDPYNNSQCSSLTNSSILLDPFPNPTTGNVNISWIASAAGSARVSVFTATGSKAFDKTIDSAATGLNQIIIDLSNLSAGLYVVVVEFGGLKKSTKVLLQQE